MERKEFKIRVDAPKEKIWDVLWSDETYPLWTAPFAEGSHAESDWKEGGEVKFLGPYGTGMLSKITKCTPPEAMHFEHTGCVVKGQVQVDSKEAKVWQGVQETYELSSMDGMTEVRVEVDIPAEYVGSFEKAFPKALQKVKELSEV